MKLQQQWIAFHTIVTKEVMRFVRIWVQTVLPAAITMSRYFVIFGHLIGSQLAPIQGYNYIDYIVPGIILMAIINNSYAVLFALGGLINAIYAKTFDDISIIPTFVLTPLTYLGGIFYSVHMLPPFWQHVSLVNPILYMINAMRYGMLGISDIDYRLALLIVIGFVVALYLFALYLLRKGTGIRY
ncbi:MAG: ABC transporter permease [Gammaproteobacteria bacterium]